jgi:hypothetical protein
MINARDTRITGEGRKQAAHASLEARRGQCIRHCRRAFLVHLLEHGGGTIDDVRDVISVPAGIDPKVFGAVPGALARAGIIERCGFTTSTRAVAHARPITVWELTDAAKARDWLEANPPWADVVPGQQIDPPIDNPTAATVGQEG